MKRGIIFLIISSALFGKGFSQDVNFSKRTIKKGIKNARCVATHKYSVKQRLELFPFKNSSSVKIVSFEQPKDTIRLLPMRYNKVDSTGLKEIKVLTKDEVNRLTDILFNYGFGKGRFIFGPPEGECYIPRNAILFTNSESETFAFIELCFQCQRFRLSSEEINLGDMCDGKYQLLKNFFAECGIKTGISEE